MEYDKPRFLGHEPDAYRTAGAILAGVVPDSHAFGCVRSYDGLNRSEILHLTNRCNTYTGGNLGVLTGKELVGVFISNAVDPDHNRALCWSCERILLEQYSSAADDDGTNLEWFTAASRLRYALSDVVLTAEADAWIKNVGEARMVLAQWAYLDFASTPDSTVLADARFHLAYHLEDVTSSESWDTFEAELLADAGDWEWQPIGQKLDPADLVMSIDNPDCWYNQLCRLFAAGATIETVVTGWSRHPLPVLRYRSGVVDTPDFDSAVPVPEKGRPVEMMRLAFESATGEEFDSTESAEAWVDTVATAYVSPGA